MKTYQTISEATPHELAKTLTDLNNTAGWLPAVGNPIIYNDDNDNAKQKFLLIIEREIDVLTVYTKEIIPESAPSAGDGEFTVEVLGGTPGTGIITKATLLTAGFTYGVGNLIDIVDTTGSGSGGQIRVDTVNIEGSITSWTLIQGGSNYIGPFTFASGVGEFGNGATFELTYEAIGSNTFSYSLDGVTWQVSPTFDNLGPGNYEVHVMDALGAEGSTHVKVITL